MTTEAAIGESLSSEIVVVGGGPAGMAAAVSATECGAEVIVVDDNAGFGGQIWRGADVAHLGPPAAHWFKRVRGANLRFLGSAQAIAASSPSQTLLVETPVRLIELRYQKLILATGARELFLPFPGWTLPGVVGVGGIQALAKSGLPVAGKRIVVAGSGPLLLAVGAYLRQNGAQVVLIAEQASRGALVRFGARLLRHPGKFVQAMALQKKLIGISYRQNCIVETAEGDGRLRRVQVRQANRHWKIDCDFAAIAYGLTANNELASLLGCRISNGAVSVDDLQETSIPNVYCAGEGTGIGGVDLSLVEGEIAGYAASGRSQRLTTLFTKRRRARHFADLLNSTFSLQAELKNLVKSDTIVCRCEDVAFERLEKAASFRSAKLLMRCGMGPCQGRICGPATGFLFGWTPESVRPPIFPARISSLAVKSGKTEEQEPQSPGAESTTALSARDIAST